MRQSILIRFKLSKKEQKNKQTNKQRFINDRGKTNKKKKLLQAVVQKILFSVCTMMDTPRQTTIVYNGGDYDMQTIHDRVRCNNCKQQYVSCVTILQFSEESLLHAGRLYVPTLN